MAPTSGAGGLGRRPGPVLVLFKGTSDSKAYASSRREDIGPYP